MADDPVPHVLDAGTGQAGAGDDRRGPLAARLDQAQGSGQLAGSDARLGFPRRVAALVVGLVDRDHIDDLQDALLDPLQLRSEEHTSELQSLMRISYAVFCLKKTKNKN